MESPPPTGVYFIKCMLAPMCSPRFHLLSSLCPLLYSLFFPPYILYLTLSVFSASCRNKRSSVPTVECIFELPHFTVQATRAQTLLLQAIWQSWSHSVSSGAALTLNESLLNEVYKAPGKQAHFVRDRMKFSSPVLSGKINQSLLEFPINSCQFFDVFFCGVLSRFPIFCPCVLFS